MVPLVKQVIMMTQSMKKFTDLSAVQLVRVYNAVTDGKPKNKFESRRWHLGLPARSCCGAACRRVAPW